MIRLQHHSTMKLNSIIHVLLAVMAFVIPSESIASTRTPDYLILGGELGNSSASSVNDIRTIFPRLKAMGLNTVLAPVYWELIEPEEGKFDFSLVEEMLSSANGNGLKIIPLWFGAWKNSMSCYAPAWVKANVKRFPRAVTAEGKPLEILSAFSQEVLKADLKAFTAFVDFLKENDKDGIVSMIQIENEIGMLESPRDHSLLADKAYALGVPKELAKTINVKACAPWSEAAEDIDYADEMFMAWNYASYVENLAKEARKKLPDVPLYVNAALDSRGRRPGQYPSAGPLARLSNIWKTAAPSIDLVSPDLYDPPFAQWFMQYDYPGNPLFVPEIRRSYDSGVHAFYAVGEHGAIGFSPFSIENSTENEAARLKEAYTLLGKVAELAKWKKTYGFLFDEAAGMKPRIIAEDGLRMTASHFFTLPWDPRATDGSRWPDGGAMAIRLDKDEYLIAGSGVVVKWETEDESQSAQANLGEDGFALACDSAGESNSSWKGKQRVGILSCDEVEVLPDGSFRIIRRLNGDETHQGRHVRISPDGFSALHVKLYRY